MKKSVYNKCWKRLQQLFILGKQMPKITITDIARQAGVRPGVVSVVLNNRQYTRVSAKRREEIQQLAERMGYRPNLEAASLSRGKKATVGVFLPPWKDVLLLELIHGLSAAGAKFSIPLTFFFGMTSESYFSFIDSMDSCCHTGLISYVPYWNQHYDKILSRLDSYIDNGGKVISLNTARWPMKKTISLDIDEAYGGELAGKYLSKIPGMQSFLLVSMDGLVYRLRDDAFCKVLQITGKPLEVYRFPSIDTILREEIIDTLCRLLAKMQKPVGIFFTSTEFAECFFHAAENLNWRYGKDFVMIGYDLPQRLGDFHPIPRIIQPFYRLGFRAVEKLGSMLHNKKVVSEIFKPELIEGRRK